MDPTNIQDILPAFMQQIRQETQENNERLTKETQDNNDRLTREIKEINQKMDVRFQEILNAIGQQLNSITEHTDKKMEQFHNDITERLDTLEARTAILEGEKELTDQQDRAITHPSASRERKTIFMKEVEETTHLAERRQVVVQMPTPSHSHIFLNSMDLADYAQFVTKWFDWQVKYGVRLEPALIVSQSIRNLLIFNNDMTESQFQELSPEQFCKLMAKETQVLSKLEFSNTLRHALRDIKRLNWERVRPNTHERFFQGILRRRDIYLRTFRIIMENNSQYCPDLEGKDFGLAQIFLNLIDDTYNKTVLAEIPKVKAGNYSKVEEFLEAYVKKAKEHYDTSKRIRLVPYSGEDYSMKSHDMRKNKPHSSQEDKYKGHETKTYPMTSGEAKPLHQINDFSDDEDQELRESRNAEPDSDDDSDYEEDPKSTAEGHDTNQRYEDKVDHQTARDQDTDYRRLQAIEASATGLGCVNFALYGKCFRGDQCKYAGSHNEKCAKDCRQWMMKKLATMERDGPGPPKIMKRDPTKS